MKRGMAIVSEHEGGVLLAVKVVPGASRDRVAGPLGERLKVQVRQPPEKGKANEGLCRVLAEALGVKAADVAVVRGHSRPAKDVLVRGLRPGEARRRLGLA